MALTKKKKKFPGKPEWGGMSVSCCYINSLKMESEDFIVYLTRMFR